MTLAEMRRLWGIVKIRPRALQQASFFEDIRRLLTYAREQAIAARTWPCECGHSFSAHEPEGQNPCWHTAKTGRGPCSCARYVPAQLDVPEEAGRG